MTDIPRVVHPKKFVIDGHVLAVATYFAITDAQAAKIAQWGFRRRKWLARDRGKKVTTILWIGDREATALLG